MDEISRNEYILPVARRKFASLLWETGPDCTANIADVNSPDRCGLASAPVGSGTSMPEEQHIAVGVLDFKSPQTIIAFLEWLKKLDIA
jgi:hypothetical protein